MQQLLEKLLDIIFPPSEETRIVRRLTPRDIEMLTTPQYVGDTITLSRYSNPTVRALIHAAKFHNNTYAHMLLGTLFKTWFASHTHAEPICIIPIPLAPTRERARGYNQVTAALRSTPLLKPYICTDILFRTRNTRPQTELHRTERLSNTKKAFAVRNPEKVRGAHIILVDDVFTTGATMSAAKTALLPHSPASITCVAIAH